VGGGCWQWCRGERRRAEERGQQQQHQMAVQWEEMGEEQVAAEWGDGVMGLGGLGQIGWALGGSQL